MRKTVNIGELQKYYPLLKEGYGTEYERFALNKFAVKMVKKYDISTVLEMPANGVMGISGIKSLVFAKLGCDVTVSHPSQEFLDNAKKIWDCFGLEADFVKTHWLNSIFKDDSFDLVWNFCVYEHFDDPEEVIREMLRVTNKYVFLEIQNVHNIGLPVHRLYHLIHNQPWDHGNMRQMNISTLTNILNGLNAISTEIGATDMPPWPDINIGLKEMLSRKKNENRIEVVPYGELRPQVRTKDVNDIVREINSFKTSKMKDDAVYRLFNIWYYLIESTTPFIFKRFFAHHPYMIAKKI